DGVGFLVRAFGLEDLDGGALDGAGGAAVKEGAGGGDGLDDGLGGDDPAGAPAGVAEALGEAVDDDDGVGVDVLDVRGRGDGAGAGPAVLEEVVGVELVHQEGAVAAARHGDPGGQFLAVDDNAGGVAGVGDEQGADLLGDDAVFEGAGGDAEAVFLAEFDPGGVEAVEGGEEVFVGGVVGGEVAEFE